MARTRHGRQGFGRYIRKRFGDILRFVPRAVRSDLVRALLEEDDAVIPSRPLPLKHVRLEQLSGAGFNVADFRFWLRNELNPEELRDFYNAKGGRLSIRHFTEERESEPSPRLPVAYDAEIWDFIASFTQTHNREHHTLVNEALPLRDSLFCGNIVLLDARRYVVSCFEGFGTPRDVDDRAKEPAGLSVFLRRFGIPAPDATPAVLAHLGEGLREFLPSFRPMTIEFSVYPYPVGRLGHHEVFWEWRGGSAHDLFELVSQLAEKTDSCEIALALPKSGSARRA